jgi:hypothetical protein
MGGKNRESKIIAAIFCVERSNVIDLRSNLYIMLFSEYWRLIGKSESRSLDNFLSNLEDDVHINVFCENYMSDLFLFGSSFPKLASALRL